MLKVDGVAVSAQTRKVQLTQALEYAMSFSIATRSTARSLLLLVSVVAVFLLTITQAKAADSLYKRLGGYDAIAGFVDTAFPRVAAHPELNHLFRGHAMDSQMRQRQLIVDSICNAAGGPCLYTGRAMKPVHVGLGITGAQWETFMKIIQTAADERKFGATEKKEFLELFAKKFRPDVVEKP